MIRQSVIEGDKNFDGEVFIGILSVEELKAVKLKIIQAIKVYTLKIRSRY